LLPTKGRPLKTPSLAGYCLEGKLSLTIQMAALGRFPPSAYPRLGFQALEASTDPSLPVELRLADDRSHN